VGRAGRKENTTTAFNGAYERMPRGDVTYRFVIENATLAA